MYNRVINYIFVLRALYLYHLFPNVSVGVLYFRLYISLIFISIFFSQVSFPILYDSAYIYAYILSTYTF